MRTAVDLIKDRVASFPLPADLVVQHAMSVCFQALTQLQEGVTPRPVEPPVEQDAAWHHGKGQEHALADLVRAYGICDQHTPDKWEGDGTCVICEGQRLADQLHWFKETEAAPTPRPAVALPDEVKE